MEALEFHWPGATWTERQSVNQIILVQALGTWIIQSNHNFTEAHTPKSPVCLIYCKPLVQLYIQISPLVLAKD